MIATYVSPIRTPVTREAILRAFLWAMPPGTRPEAVALALAQWGIETGRGKSMYNSNPGNAKASPTYEGNYTCFPCNEVIGGTTHWYLPEGPCDSSWNLIRGLPTFAVPPGHPQTRFRAYANIWDGTLQHVALLEGRFAPAWPALLAGDASVFVHALKVHGYFTAPEGPYHAGVASLQREFLRVLDGIADEPEVEVDEGLARLLRYADALLVEGSREVVA